MWLEGADAPNTAVSATTALTEMRCAIEGDPLWRAAAAPARRCKRYAYVGPQSGPELLLAHLVGAGAAGTRPLSVRLCYDGALSSWSLPGRKMNQRTL